MNIFWWRTGSHTAMRPQTILDNAGANSIDRVSPWQSVAPGHCGSSKDGSDVEKIDATAIVSEAASNDT